jgi:hypothetical protein
MATDREAVVVVDADGLVGAEVVVLGALLVVIDVGVEPASSPGSSLSPQPVRTTARAATPAYERIRRHVDFVTNRSLDSRF